MKITLTNATFKTSCTVNVRSKPTMFFHRTAYKISKSTFYRIIRKLNPEKKFTFSNTYKDQNFRLVISSRKEYLIVEK